MPKVHRTHHTRLDSLSVAPYDVKTLFGIDGGPLEMVSDFFFPGHRDGQMGPYWKSGPRVKIPPGNCLMGQIKSQCMGKHDQGPFLLCPSTSSGQLGSKNDYFWFTKWPLGENSTRASWQSWNVKIPQNILPEYITLISCMFVYFYAIQASPWEFLTRKSVLPAK